MHYGMIATGDHSYYDSLRSATAPPSSEQHLHGCLSRSIYDTDRRSHDSALRKVQEKGLPQMRQSQVHMR